MLFSFSDALDIHLVQGINLIPILLLSGKRPLVQFILINVNSGTQLFSHIAYLTSGYIAYFLIGFSGFIHVPWVIPEALTTGKFL
jgi:hypothetical protein